MTNYTIYRLFDYETGLYVGKEFSDVREFFDYHIKHTFTDYPEYGWQASDFFYPRYETQHTYGSGRRAFLYFEPRKPGMFRNRYVIKDEYGKSFGDARELYQLAYPPKPWKPFRWYHEDYVEPLVHLPKNNVNKMVPEVWSWYFRGVRTTNEHRQNDAHINEYEEEYGELVRPSRRGYNLPTSWDDKPNSVWKTRKSWKHNSRRKCQWKQK